MRNLWERLHLPMPAYATPEKPRKKLKPRARDIAAEVRETLKYERRDEECTRLVGTSNGPHVQTPASESRAPGATHLPVAGGHHRVRQQPRTGVRRMQVPSETRDVHTPTAGRPQTAR